MEEPNIAALVPMKAVSERLNNKNMRLLNGRPMCYYVLRQLTQSSHIKAIYVDTNSEVIKNFVLSEFENIRVIDRDPDLCDQMVSIEKVIERDMQKIGASHYFQTFATSPLLSVDTIDKAISTYFEGLPKFDSLFSVTKLQKRLYTPSGICINPSPHITRNQDLEPFYIQNASFFIFSKASFGKLNKRISDRPFMYELFDAETVDVDYAFDFELAERILKNRIDE